MLSSRVSPRRFSVRCSGVHGRGVFALRAIGAGDRVVQFRGDVLTWDEACDRHANAGGGTHTWFFDRADGTVLDGSSNGNSARWLNHGCEPNCEAVVDEAGRIVIVAVRDIEPGAELLLDYQLDGAGAADDYPCRCGSRACRGTMLAPA